MTLREKLDLLGASTESKTAIELCDAHFALHAGFRNVLGLPETEWASERAELTAHALALLQRRIETVDKSTFALIRARVEDRRLTIDLSARGAQLKNSRATKIANWLASHTEDLPAPLVAAIEADPDDVDSYRVLADALIDKGVARGELIARQLAGKLRVPAKSLGPLADYLAKPWQSELTWFAGFIRTAKLAIDDYTERTEPGVMTEAVALLLKHPAARFLTQLSIGLVNIFPHDEDLQPAVAAIAALAPSTLSRIAIGAFEFPSERDLSAYSVGNVAPLGKLALRDLELQGAHVGLAEMPTLERLVIRTAGLPAEAARVVARAPWPKLRHLELWFGSEDQGCTTTLADLEPLFARRDVELHTLALRNCGFADELCSRVVRSPLFARVRRLDLSLGTLANVQPLVAHGLAHLAELDVSDNYIDDVAALRALPPKLVADRQRADTERYVSVGE